MRFILFLFILQTVIYGSKNLFDENINFSQELKEYQIQSLTEKNFTLYDPAIFMDYVPKDININEQLTSPQRKLAEGFVYTQVFMISTIFALYLMPENVSNWDKEEISSENLLEKWKQHVEEGPVWDKDDFVINYIGHPVSGAWYYTAARGYGISSGGSFLYSAFLSTFIWEYGYEAFAEVPSWQDIFSTPIVGSLMGEGFYMLEKKIDKKEGKVLGSKVLGSISYFFLNPLGNISEGLSDFFDVDATFRLQTYQPYYSMEQQRLHLFQNTPEMFLEDYGFLLDIQY